MSDNPTPTNPSNTQRRPTRRPEFRPYAVVFGERLILKTPYNAEFVQDIKQIPAKLRAFVKDGRPLEKSLRQHLEDNEDYFASQDELAAIVEALVASIAASRGLSEAWVVALGAPELFEWAVGSALKQFPDLELHDVRRLESE